MFARILNMPRILNMLAFWIYGGCEYGRVLNIPGLWKCYVSKYARVTQGFEYAWICLNNSWICLIMSKCPYICLNGFCFTFTHCNSLSKRTIDRFLGKVKFDFFVVPGSIWFYLFYIYIFKSKISNLLLPFRAEGVRGRESYPTNDIPNKYIYDVFLMIYLSILLLFLYILVLQRR